eukprot:3931611-Rhodomonas_salina.1
MPPQSPGPSRRYPTKHDAGSTPAPVQPPRGNSLRTQPPPHLKHSPQPGHAHCHAYTPRPMPALLHTRGCGALVPTSTPCSHSACDAAVSGQALILSACSHCCGSAPFPQ